MSHRIALPETAFQGSAASIDEDDGRLFMRWVRGLPCIVSLTTDQTIAHHVRLERAADGTLKSHNQLGKRPSDWNCVPLAHGLHDPAIKGSLHSGNEADFWRAHRIDPLIVNNGLKYVFASLNRDTDYANLMIKSLRKVYR